MEKITITNFRKIKETWELELAPVTFLVGTNNSGKSSVLKALLLLDSYGSSRNNFILDFNKQHAKNHKIDCFSNAINRANFSNKNYNIKFKVETSNYNIFYEFMPLEEVDGKFEKGKLKEIQFVDRIDNSEFKITHLAFDEYQISLDNSFINSKSLKEEDELYFSLDELNNFKNDILSEIKKFKDDHKKSDLNTQLHLKFQLENLNSRLKSIDNQIKELLKKKKRDDLKFNPTFSIEEFQGVETIDRILRRVLSKYFRENEKEIGLVNSNKELFKISMLADNLIDSLFLNVCHLTPNRNSQTRLYVNENNSNDIFELIKIHSENPIDKKSDAGKFLKDWMKIFDIGEDFRIKQIEGLASLIEIKEGNVWVNLVDKGFGAGQIFTILLRIALVINDRSFLKLRSKNKRFKSSKPLILIEEPESNLHPLFQSKLAELFFSTSQKYDIQFIVETHSEYVIRNSQVIYNSLKKQMKILDIEPLRVYYFAKDGIPYDMKYRNDGRFTNEFGTGFFDVNSNLIFDLH